MKKELISNRLQNVKTKAKSHTPDIFIIVGISGMIGTAVMAARATPKAVTIMEGIKENNENPDKLTIVKEVAPVYIPSAILCSISISFILAANKIRIDREIAIATAYKLTRDNFSDYKNKVIEKIGDKKAGEVSDDIAKDKIDDNPVEENYIIETGKGAHLCYDGVTGRYFLSDIEEIRKTVNDLNETMIRDNYVSLNDFHEALGLPPTEMGDRLGWHISCGLIDVHFSSQIAYNKEPCLVIMYNISPGYDYEFEYLV